MHAQAVQFSVWWLHCDTPQGSLTGCTFLVLGGLRYSPAAGPMGSPTYHF